MSKILCLAESGSGKTSSLRFLEPTTTAIVNCDRKELPLYGWKRNYKDVRNADGTVDWSQTNFLNINSPLRVLKSLQEWEKQPRIKTIVIDTITHMLTNDYMENAIGKDYKSYQMMAKNFVNILEQIRSSEKNVIVFGHLKRDINEMGEVYYDMRLHGKMLSELVPASYFTTVLLGEIKRKEGASEYLFRTQSLGGDPAKSPAYFVSDSATTALEFHEPNDMKKILEKLDAFDTGI